MNGYIKLYRKLLDWEWFNEPNTLQLFIYMLLKANWTDSKWKGIDIKKGQLITSIASLCEATGQTARSIRTGINRLKSTNEVTIKTTNKYSLVTIANWALYQSNDDETTSKTTSNVTNERQANDKQTTTDKEYNKNKEEEEEDNMFLYGEDSDSASRITNKQTGSGRRLFTAPTVDDVIAYCKERNNRVDAHKFFDFYESKGWMVGKSKMKDWKASVRTWERNSDNNYTKQPTLFPQMDKPKQDERAKPQKVNYVSRD